MADLGYRFPDYPVPPGETQTSFLRAITEVGARDRYRPYHERARAQIARELDLIEKLDLAGYFLIVWDIVNFCRQHDILVQGRGSAANSAVCYSLGITAVDPVGMDLLFERFLSEERGEWPDIDLDLPSGDRRERVIQHVYEKYGRLGAAMTANVITYRGRSAAREVGKALGFDAAQVDRLAQVMNHFEFDDPAETLPRHLASVGLDLNADRVRLFARLWGQMQDLPRHLGQHSGGMVICQGQLDAVVPLENASMPGRVVVQWDKDDCADMGIVKVDLLGLGMMAALQDALALVNGEGRLPRPVPGATPETRLDLAHLPPDDPAVYRMLQDADTIGVFQVESRAQMATLPRLKPATFYDIVVQVAIIRPGPIVGPDGASVFEPPGRPGAGALSASLARADPRADARRAAVSGAVAAHGDGRGRFHRRTGRGVAPGVRVQAIRAADEAGRECSCAREWRGRASRETRRRRSSCRSPRSRCTGSPNRTRPASRCWRMRARISRCITRRRSIPRSSTTSRWGSTIRRRSSRTRSAAASASCPIDVQVSDWECTVEADGAIRLGLRYVSGLRQDLGERIATSRGPRATAPLSGAGPDVGAACPKCGCDDATMLERTDGGGYVLQRLRARSDRRRAASPRSTISSPAPDFVATSW